jgi:hypothetical protein
MERPAPDVLARMPLAEAVLLLWRWVADEAHLQNVFEQCRGRCYQRIISFALLVHLIADALLEFAGSGRRSFQRSKQRQELEASVRAVYGKLSRLPIRLSMAFLAACTDRLRPLYPEQVRTRPPKSLTGLRVVVFDGKALKRVAKRLKALRGIPGGLLGGRALVALDLESGLALAFHGHPDGDANDVRFVADLLPEVRRRLPGPRLMLGDRGFCDLTNTPRFMEAGDHFLVRYHPKAPFCPDPTRSSQEGTDSHGRVYRDQWGWLGSPKNPKRFAVRVLTLQRPGEEDLILVTDLLDATVYPATDLLELYRMRWGIERMFHQVTEVFGLQRLIGSSPEATVFQFAFCLVLYNLIQLVRAVVAAAQERERETISTENLFEDVRRELIAWNVMITPLAAIAYLADFTAPQDVQKRLQALLGSIWKDTWIKAPPKRRKYAEPEIRARTHGSVYRILQEHRQAHNQQKSGRKAPQ